MKVKHAVLFPVGCAIGSLFCTGSVWSFILMALALISAFGLLVHLERTDKGSDK